MIKVTIKDLETGKQETKEFDNDYLLICAGNKYLDGIQHYPGRGTTVLTVKTEQPERTLTPEQIAMEQDPEDTLR